MCVQKVPGTLTVKIVRVEAWRRAAERWEWALGKERDRQRSLSTVLPVGETWGLLRVI